MNDLSHFIYIYFQHFTRTSNISTVLCLENPCIVRGRPSSDIDVLREAVNELFKLRCLFAFIVIPMATNTYFYIGFAPVTILFL